MTDLPCGYDGFVRSNGQLPVHQTQFNCHPSFMRLTVNNFPSTQALSARIKLPLGVIVRPMADTQPGDETEIPVVGPSNAGVVRCKNCRTYINPYVKFLDGGRRWSCNICGRPNEVPGDYFCNLDAQGLRKDRMERPELSCGSVEYVAPQDYMSRPPQPPVYMFVLDASQRAVTSGLLFQTCVAIKENLQHIRGNERTKIGIIAYNNSVHFFPFKAGGSFKQLVVSDIADVILPQPDDLLVSLTDNSAEISQLLDRLPSMFTTTSQDGAFGAALKGGVMCMQHLGGKLIATVSHTPIIGEGSMKMREDSRSTDPAREAALLQPQSEFYKNFAVDNCSKHHISCDIIAGPSTGPMDLASLAPLPRFTNGQLLHYPSFDGNRDGIQLRIDLNRMVTRSVAFEAVMRIRCTKGVKVNAFYGNFFFKSNDLLATPTNDCDKAFCAELEYEEPQLAATQVHVQSALLYTSSNGERRIRVHNLNVPVTANPAEVYANADCEALATFFGRQAADLMSNAKVADARLRVQQALIDVVKSHRAAVQQMTLPPSISCLPLYLLGFLKSSAMRDSADVRPDERVAALHRLGGAPVSFMILQCCPYIAPLHSLGIGNDWGESKPDGSVCLPPRLLPRMDVLTPDGIYIAFNGSALYVWLGKSCDASCIHEMFGFSSVDQADGAVVHAQDFGSDRSRRCCNVLRAVQALVPHSCPIQMVKQGGLLEIKFHMCLIEDRHMNLLSYTEWWAALGRQSQ